MPNQSPHRALIVSSEHDWRNTLVPKLIDPDWDLYVVSRAIEGTDLLTKKRFDLIVVDDSLRDMDPPEFCLAINDLASNNPLVLVAGEELDRYQRLWKYCAVHMAGSRDEVGRSVKTAMQHAADHTVQ
jgi:DNA-binding response OmpR family regulator